jgi:hypothetical protein
VGHHQAEARISEKTHILQCGHQEWGNEISFLQCLGRCVAVYTRCGICTSYDFICRVFCRFVDTWAGVVMYHDAQLTKHHAVSDISWFLVQLNLGTWCKLTFLLFSFSGCRYSMPAIFRLGSSVCRSWLSAPHQTTLTFTPTSFCLEPSGWTTIKEYSVWIWKPFLQFTQK